MGYCEKVLNLAARQVGYKEEKSKGDNWTKYGRWFDTKGEGWQWFNGKKNGIPGANGGWCVVFICWIFCQNEILGREKARKFLGVPQPKDNLAAGCGYFYDYLKAKGYKSTVANAKPGDIIFFKSGGKCSHVGIVEKADNTYIYTIEGNKGDAVARVKHRKDSNIYFGNISPDYAALDKAEAPASDPSPVKPEPIIPAPVAPITYNMKVTTRYDYLMLRAYASTSAPVLQKLKKGTTVIFQGEEKIVSGSTWVKVKFNSIIGWACKHESGVTYNYLTKV